MDVNEICTPDGNSALQKARTGAGHGGDHRCNGYHHTCALEEAPWMRELKDLKSRKQENKASVQGSLPVLTELGTQ